MEEIKAEAVTGSAVTYTVQIEPGQHRTLSGIYLMLCVLVVLECRKLVRDIVRRQNGGKQ